jgi:hypothetical protein
MVLKRRHSDIGSNSGENLAVLITLGEREAREHTTEVLA